VALDHRFDGGRRTACGRELMVVSGVMDRPTPAYLKRLIEAFGEKAVPVEIRNQCHRLMRAIEMNHLESVEDTVKAVERLAAEHGLELPRVTSSTATQTQSIVKMEASE
jgi:hypothetical protein